MLSEEADKRLKAIKEFTEFGSGFKIAMRDLEIRGAGSLLGEIQSGHLEQVGYDTYCNLLDEVVKEMQGTEIESDIDIQIDLNVTSYIPDEYIEDSAQKIEIYQNIALCRKEEDIQNVVDEIIDRFGNMPAELENLLDIARIKYISKKLDIEKIADAEREHSFRLDHALQQIDLLVFGMGVHDRGHGRKNFLNRLNEFRLVGMRRLYIIDDTGYISIHFGKSSSKMIPNQS